jgi:hypothetical protein
MRDQLPDLRLDVEVIEIDRKVREGLARAYLTSAERPADGNAYAIQMIFAATNFRTAGAHSILLDDGESATKWFREAAIIYAKLGVPYAVMMSVLTGDREDSLRIFNGFAEQFAGWRERRLTRSVDSQSAYLLMFQAAIQDSRRYEANFTEDDLNAVRGDLHASGSKPVGVLGLPVQAYLNLAAALSNHRAPSLDEALMPFVSAYDDAIRRASLRSYHWKMMALPFHPAEPDILSVLTIVQTTLAKTNRSVLSILDEFPLSRESRTILSDAMRLISPS